MQLTVRDVAKYFRLSERTVYRWIDQKIIPAYRVNDQYRFNRSELLEWAAAQKITVYPDFFDDEDVNAANLPTLTDSLKNGGIYYRLEGDTRDDVLKSVVGILPLPEGIDRNVILQILIAREKLSSTGIGDGIAIPHIRNPMILNVHKPILSLCFLEKPIDFEALDGKPVDSLFAIICPNSKVHLHIISRLCFLLKDNGFKKAISSKSTRTDILAAADKAEAKLAAAPDNKGAS